MISTLEKEITFRYLKARKKDGFLNIISIFSFIGISLGVAVLIIVMSVMNGFRTELINKIIGFNSHITVKPYEKKYINPARFNNSQLNSISKNLISSNTGEAIIIQKDVTKGIVLRGYSKNDFSKLKIIKDETFIGDRDNLTKNYISIGKELSFNDNKPIFITSKDYVKLKKLRNKNIWIINHKIYPNDKFKSELSNKLKEIDIR